MKVLITGITGFVGSHLAEFLLRKSNIEVYAIKRWRSNTENLEGFKDQIKLFECDIRDASSVRRVVSEILPDMIFHLAAQTFVPTSWHAPTETLTTNIIGELNLLEAVRESKINPKIHIAGSSEEYGLVSPQEIPIKETNCLRPLSSYGVSKVAQDLLGFQYYHSYKLNIVRTRGFNHTGPRRGEVFVTSTFAKQIVSIEKGIQEPVVYVGNLEAVRDFTDVRDMVRAYVLSLEKCQIGEVYNICSGKGYKILDILEILLGFCKVKVNVKKDRNRMRPSDVPILIGDNSKFKEETGWEPKISFEKTLRDLLDYWRRRLRTTYVEEQDHSLFRTN